MNGLQPRATIDFESRSACSIRACGSWRYSLDASTEVLCLAYRLPYWPDGRTGLWHPSFPQLGIDEGDSFDDLGELFAWIDEGEIVEAHNAFFERGLWTNQCAPKFGWPVIRNHQWRCSAAKAAAHALPRGLDDAASALHLDIRKDAEGGEVMKKVSKPRKPVLKERNEWGRLHRPCGTCAGVGKVQGVNPVTGRAKKLPCGVCNGTGYTGRFDTLPDMPVLYHESRELFETLWAYCRQDVLVEEQVSHALPDLSAAETRMYELDQTINERGFQLDTDAIDTAEYLIENEFVDLNAELYELTEGAVSKATQRARMMEWFSGQGLELDDTQADTLDTALERTDLAANVRRGLELVRTLGKSSTAKYCVSPDTKVLKADLTWVSAAEIQEGDRLIGFDEHSSSRQGQARTFQPATVIAVTPINSPRVRVHTSEGEIVVSADHSFLLRNRRFSKGHAVRPAGWKDAQDLQPGDDLVFLNRPWAVDTSRDGGYVAGILDGEGCLSRGRASWSQNPGVVWDSVTEALEGQGIQCSLGVTQENGDWHVRNAFVGGVGATLEVLGVFRPHRLLAKSEQVWCGRRIFSKRTRYARVMRVEELSVGPVVAIETSTGTLITDGYFSHNCAMRNWVCPDSRVHGGLLYHGATTGRWTGAGVQPHNFPRGELTEAQADPEFVWAMLKTRDRELISSEFGTVMGALSSALRGVIVAAPGRQLYCADFNAIECRGLLWLARDEAGLDIFRRGEDPYCVMASSIFNRPVTKKDKDERQLGKTAILGLGYQMGASKFVDTALLMGGITIKEDSNNPAEVTAKKVVDAYRVKFWRVKNLWRDVEQAAIKAVLRPGSAQVTGRVTFCFDKGKDFLYCVLPSGRRLAYPSPRVLDRMMPWGDMKPSLTYMGINAYTRKWTRQNSYGGMLVENIVQALCRDLMAEAMLRAEESGVYQPILSVHDELLAEADEGAGDVHEFEQLMAELPRWAAGMPVTAEGWAGGRYRK